ncbi:hypothetical protein [Leptolyngbya sp. NIES-2104]|uniref:hypothetical protein n=1 Tax=Leptolyngbya sp. NIES-2104 TaxID=1552121 RepID=UPI0006ECAB41|nr:hypothetical protein [Leptolyngbya sp. NIES-2104]GAP97267.1 hypothetical protein NIES2104_38140 [Leptolyngbya sp. NIES-2104]
MGRPRKYGGLYDRQKAYKARSGYDKKDERCGYRAGYNQAKAGREKPDIRDRSSEYQAGYEKGYAAGQIAFNKTAEQKRGSLISHQ